MIDLNTNHEFSVNLPLEREKKKIIIISEF